MKTKTSAKKAITHSDYAYALRDKTTLRETLNKGKQKTLVKKSMTFAEILEKHPESANILFESGLHCIGCGMAMHETLEQGCLVHGMNKKQIDELVRKINLEIKK